MEMGREKGKERGKEKGKGNENVLPPQTSIPPKNKNKNNSFENL